MCQRLNHSATTSTKIWASPRLVFIIFLFLPITFQKCQFNTSVGLAHSIMLFEYFRECAQSGKVLPDPGFVAAATGSFCLEAPLCMATPDGRSTCECDTSNGTFIYSWGPWMPRNRSLSPFIPRKGKTISVTEPCCPTVKVTCPLERMLCIR